jgi:hypothetical protein
MEAEDIYLTSKQAPEFLTKRGFQTSQSYFRAIMSPGSGRGVRPDRRYGNRSFWKQSTLLRWAESRCSPVGSANE